MIRQMVIAKALPAVNDPGHLVTSFFLLMDHFLYRIEENLSTRSLIFFCKMHHRIPLFLALRLSVRRISNAY